MKKTVLLLGAFCLILSSCTFNLSMREYVLNVEDIRDGSKIDVSLDFEILAETAEEINMSPNNDVKPLIEIPFIK